MVTPGTPPIRIAVLGAGYGGLAAFLELQDRLDRQAYDLVLVNATPYHWFLTELHALAAGVEEEEVLRISLRRMTRRPGRLLVDRVERLLPERRSVLLRDAGALAYDFCIVALGSDPEYFNLPGVREHALLVGNPEGAARLRERLAAAAQAGAGAPSRVVVAGGGLTGVETAAELADAYPDTLRIALVEAGSDIMPGFDPYLVGEARRVLQEKGVDIRTGTPIARVDPDQVRFAAGPPLPYDLLVWAGGVRGSGVLARSGLAVTPRGRARADRMLRAEGHPEVYLVGDAASYVDPDTGREIPPTAQAAVQMGRHVARNLLARLTGRPEEPFQPRIRGAFASLGRGAGVGFLGQEKYVGLPATVVKRLIEAHHAYEAGGLVPVLARALRPAVRLLARRWPPAGARAGRPEPDPPGAAAH